MPFCKHRRNRCSYTVSSPTICPHWTPPAVAIRDLDKKRHTSSVGQSRGYELADQPMADVKLELIRYTQSEGELVDFPDPSAFKLDVSGGEVQLIKAERSQSYRSCRWSR